MKWGVQKVGKVENEATVQTHRCVRFLRLPSVAGTVDVRLLAPSDSDCRDDKAPSEAGMTPTRLLKKSDRSTTVGPEQMT